MNNWCQRWITHHKRETMKQTLSGSARNSSLSCDKHTKGVDAESALRAALAAVESQVAGVDHP